MIGPSERGGYGPEKARIVCVGEAYGREEDSQGRPFCGGAGKELRLWLRNAGIDPDAEVYYTNVINKRPMRNQFKEFCLKAKDARAEYPKWKPVLEMQAPQFPWPEKYIWPAVMSGGYLHPQYLHELPALYDEIMAKEPTLVIPLGNIACWAILGHTGITKIRGACAWSDSLGVKCLPMLHPAAILRQYELQPLCLADMLKAASESQFADLIRPSRQLWIDPTLEDLRTFNQYMQRAHDIGCDIETAPEAGLIKTVGFSADTDFAIVVPFYDHRQPEGSYWQTTREEQVAWDWVKCWLGLPQSKIFQNGAYDVTWLWALVGMTPSSWEDTMLQAHALQPELPKDLATLGSIYTNEPAWKFNFKHKTNKDAE